MTNYFLDRATPPVALLPDIKCGPADVKLFFPEDMRGTERVRATRQARQMCFECPHQEPCLTWALDTNQQWGFWGGTTAYEREQLRRKKNTHPLQRPRTA